MRRQQSGRSVSRLASRHTAAIFSDIIAHENLKVLRILFLAQKVYVLFNFLLCYIVLVTELMARPSTFTRYLVLFTQLLHDILTLSLREVECKTSECHVAHYHIGQLVFHGRSIEDEMVRMVREEGLGGEGQVA